MNRFKQVSKENPRNGFVAAYDDTKIKSDGLGFVYYYERKRKCSVRLENDGLNESHTAVIKWRSR